MQEKSTTKNLIAANAAELFYASGYTKATMRKIAEQSGITHAAIFKHYKNKGALAALLIYRYLYGLIRMSKQFIEEHPQQLGAGVLFYWGAHYAMLTQDEHFARLYSDIYQNNDEEFVDTMSTYSDAIFRYLFDWPYQTDGIDYYIDMKMMTYLDLTLAQLCSEKEITVYEATERIMDLQQAMPNFPLRLTHDTVHTFIAMYIDGIFDGFDVYSTFLRNEETPDILELLINRQPKDDKHAL